MSLLLAILLLVMVVAQLFTFDHFLELLVTFSLPFGSATVPFVAAALVITEVFALPFLLRMPLSPAFRWVSMVSGWLATLLWVKLTFWVVVTEPLIESVGFLGTLVPLIPGWWAIFVALSLVILSGWASWGMWPGKRK